MSIIDCITVPHHHSSNEASSSIYSTDFIQKMLQEEGGSLFDSRSASLGHTLQGGIPSPMDRARAVRLSLKCMVFLERHHDEIRLQPEHKRRASRESAAVITIQGSRVELTPVQDMVQHADMKNRRGKNSWWEQHKALAEALGGKTPLMFDYDHEKRVDAKGGIVRRVSSRK